SRWQQPFDAALTDVFQVQADIANSVAHGLGVALGGAEQLALARRPTDNLAAYDAYLQGEATSQAMNSGDQPSLQRAANLYAQALDPRSVSVARGLATALLSLRRWPDARAAAARGLAVAPTMLELIGDQIVSYLGEGDVAAAQRVLRGVPRKEDQATLLVALV